MEETSQVPFYVAGGLLAAFAVLVSVLGFRRPDFPGGAAGQRGVTALGTLLVAATVTAAVLTA